jgi:diguanylate cyclase (GGDEF)-like protein
MVLPFRASIQNERQLTAYVIRVTSLCLAGALAVDGPLELMYFNNWAMCFREWGITIVLVFALTIPVARAFGKAALELHRAKSVADRLSLTDPLTGLLNRRAMTETANRGLPEVLALVIVDIDRFKHVNDTYGHLAGDAVLQSVSRIMGTDLGAFGCLARMGGEEFALACSKVPLDLLYEKLSEFRARVEATPVVIGGQAITVTISIGVAARTHEDTFDRIFSRADRALYLAKSSGRNRLHVYSEKCDLKEPETADQVKRESASRFAA